MLTLTLYAAVLNVFVVQKRDRQRTCEEEGKERNNSLRVEGHFCGLCR
jgi:hypothetical protein